MSDSYAAFESMKFDRPVERVLRIRQQLAAPRGAVLRCVD
jgi:hypothetical protein